MTDVSDRNTGPNVPDALDDEEREDQLQRATEQRDHRAIRVHSRRERVKRLLSRRLGQQEIADALRVSLRTIERDIQAIRGEAARELTSTSVLDVAGDVLRRSKVRDQELWLMLEYAKETKDSEAMMAALRELRANAKDEVSVLQSLGVVWRAPERVAVDMRVMTQLEQLGPSELARLADISDPAAFQQELVSLIGEHAAAEALGMPALPPGRMIPTVPRAVQEAEEVEVEIIEEGKTGE